VALDRSTTLRPADLGLALMVVVAWGLNFVVMKTGLAHLPPMLLGALRFSLAAFPALLFVPRPELPFKFFLAYGLTASVGQFAFLFSAIAVGMPTGLASLVLQSQAFFTLVLAAVFLKEHWGGHQLAGLGLAGVGLALIGSAHGAHMPLLGFGLTLAAASMWASSNVVTRVIGARGPINQLGLVVWGSLVPPIPFALLSLWLEGPHRIADAMAQFNLLDLAALAYLAWVATLFGYGIWTRLLTRYPVNQVAPFSLLVPVVGLTTGWLVYGEALQAIHFAGAALLMAGLAVNVWGKQWWYRWRR
jgi:O-acetylserine/cysteine efflux transporter